MTFESIQRSAKRLLSSLWFLSEYHTSISFGPSTSFIGLFFFFFIHFRKRQTKKAIIPLQIVLTSPVCFAIGIHAVYFACFSIRILAVYFARFSIGILAVYFACLLFTTCLSCSHFRRPLVILWRSRQPCTTTSKSGIYGIICPICTILALCFLYSVPHP